MPIFKIPPIDAHDLAVIEQIEDARQRLKYALGTYRRWTGLLARVTTARAIQGSNSIEGYNVSVDDAIAAVENEEPLDAKREAWLAIKGYREALTYVLQLADDPHFRYEEGIIRSLHFMMMSHDLVKHPGRWRPGTIYVRREATGEIVYEGPDAELVPRLIAEFVEKLNEPEAAPVMVRAAMAHLNLVMIHPFSDGNGRMARALQTLVLVREGILAKEFCSIEEYLGEVRHEYYQALAAVGGASWNPSRSARPFLRFCLTAHLRQAERLVRRTKMWDFVWTEIEEIMKKLRLPERTVYALADAAMGFAVRNATYRPMAEIPDQLASRDLKLLVDAGLLTPVGERRGRSYRAAPTLLTLRERAQKAFPIQPFKDPYNEAA